MWDEKQFFEEYKKESKQIQPDPDFTKKMKALAKQEEVKKPKMPVMRVAAVAASFVICIGVGAVAWNGIHSAKNSQMEHSYLAGAAENSQEIQQGEMNTEETEMMQDTTEEASVTQNSEDVLKEAVEAMRQGADVRDGEGNMVSEQEQQELFELLKNVESSSEDVSEKAIMKCYQIEEGETIFTIEIYEENYIQINGSVYKK
ncbi:MAG: hypothetical protein ACI4HI_12410 [Lachnospiraceae bacterium]